MTENVNQSKATETVSTAPAQTTAETKPKAAAKTKAASSVDTSKLVVSTCKIVGAEEKGVAVPAGKTFIPREEVLASIKHAVREPTDEEIAVYLMTNRSRDEAAAEDVVG